MREEKVATRYETVYIAKDNTRWYDKKQCKQYEELLENPAPLKSLKFFSSKGNPIDVFALGEIPCSCYLVIEKEIKKYHWSVVKEIIGSKDNVKFSYDLPTSKGIYFNINAYGDFFGSSGWKEQESIEYLENKIKSYQDKIELLKKIMK